MTVDFAAFAISVAAVLGEILETAKDIADDNSDTLASATAIAST